MPSEKLNKYLEDILTAIDNIEKTTLGLNVSHYSNHEICWVVERGIEIISEALKRAFNVDPNLQITQKEKIFGTRNKIAHEYDIIDLHQLYVIVNKYLPILRNEIHAILDETE